MTESLYDPSVFRAYRRRRGWSQAEAAARAGRTADWWSRLERGRVRPTVRDIAAAAHVLGIKPATLARALFESARQPDER